MVLAYNNVSVVTEKAGKVIIPIHIFCHAVDDLDDAQIGPCSGSQRYPLILWIPSLDL